MTTSATPTDLLDQRNHQTAPLPCRGCTPDCLHYAYCEGKPWRIDAALGRLAASSDKAE